MLIAYGFTVMPIGDQDPAEALGRPLPHHDESLQEPGRHPRGVRTGQTQSSLNHFIYVHRIYITGINSSTEDL